MGRKEFLIFLGECLFSVELFFKRRYHLFLFDLRLGSVNEKDAQETLDFIDAQ